jgi:hypothetical protein
MLSVMTSPLRLYVQIYCPMYLSKETECFRNFPEAVKAY